MTGMYLRTLGGCALEGASFRREKPLILLAYLIIEGPRPRRFLAELFWPGAADPMNSLAVALSKLRSLGAVLADEERAWSTLAADATEFMEHLRAGRPNEAIEIYRGAFLDGLGITLEEELEDWVLTTRDHLASGARSALLRQAEREASLGRFAVAGRLAEQALALNATTPAEAPDLSRIHALLVAAESPLVEAARREAQELGLNLSLAPEGARGRLRQSLVGRDRELEKLLSLQSGDWAYLRGASGMGKTALLRRLAEENRAFTYLPARSGLPYATLEPLLGRSVEEGAPTMLRQLSRREGGILIDDLEQTDPESRALLLQLRPLRPSLTVVLAGQAEPSSPAELLLELGPLSREALIDYPGAFEATGGIPGLLAAYLQGEGVREALEARLVRLSPQARELFLALCLFDEPDPLALREALGLTGIELARALEDLVELAFAEPSGRIRIRSAAQEYHEAHPAETARIALRLARTLSPLEAHPLWQRARALWEPADQTQVGQAYRAWSTELLRRGFPKRAAEMLLEAPAEPATLLLRARALERAQQYREGLELLQGLEASPEVLALRGAILWRLGRTQEAKEASEQALHGSEAARAEALNTLALLASLAGQHAEAASLLRRSASLWLLLGDRGRRAGALNNLAIAQSELGQDAEAAFGEALEAAGDDLALRARTLINLGRVREGRPDRAGAVAAYQEAATLAQEAGALGTAARAWNNLGALEHPTSPQAAREAYQRSLALARQAGEKLLLATSLINLAELTHDREALEEALRLSEESGFAQLVTYCRERLSLPSGSS
jgi:tetratricopeptide (TPR) repeat protein